jgi:hypothetical protein
MNPRRTIAFRHPGSGPCRLLRKVRAAEGFMAASYNIVCIPGADPTFVSSEPTSSAYKNVGKFHDSTMTRVAAD